MSKNLAGDGRMLLPRMARARVILPLVVILAAAGIYLIYQVLPDRQPGATQPPLATVSEAALENEYGLHINLVAVTAAGGMIDLRFKVLDREKAAKALDTLQPRLAVIDEDSGTVIQAPADTKQNLNLQDGMVYFVQFPNSGHAVEAGRPVSLVLGNVRVEHVPAQ